MQIASTEIIGQQKSDIRFRRRLRLIRGTEFRQGQCQPCEQANDDQERLLFHVMQRCVEVMNLLRRFLSGDDRDVANFQSLWRGDEQSG